MPSGENSSLLLMPIFCLLKAKFTAKRGVTVCISVFICTLHIQLTHFEEKMGIEFLFYFINLNRIVFHITLYYVMYLGSTNS